MKNNISITIQTFLLILTFTFISSCKKNHNSPEKEIFTKFNFNTSNLDNNIEIEDYHIYIFNNLEILSNHKHYNQNDLNKGLSTNIREGYFYVFILNSGENFTPKTEKGNEKLTLADFVSWINTVNTDYPKMYSGFIEINKDLESYGKNIEVNIKKSSDAITLNDMNLSIPIPIQNSENISLTEYNLRCYLDIYKKGASVHCLRKEIIIDNDGDFNKAYDILISLTKGKYDAFFWIDFIKKNDPNFIYKISSINDITMMSDNLHDIENYYLNAFYSKTDIDISSNNQSKTINLISPIAKYVLISNDIEAYKKLIKNKNYPPLEDLSFEISYKDFFPNSFNIPMESPSKSKAGIKYTYTPENNFSEDNFIIGNDCIFSSNKKAYINISVIIYDKNHKKIDEIKNIKIEYSRDKTTYIKGNFLTHNLDNNTFVFDTTWDEIYINF
ncbi:MAG: hypothetical protein IMY73_02385 [Bacteroidetes bacterium]|nr:hypothetical protein [Bacteroidota bacterium]